MNVPALAALLDAGVQISVNQVQFSLLDRRPLNGMTSFCSERGIKLLTYGTVAGGLLSDKYAAPAARVNLDTSSLKMYMRTIELGGGQDAWRALLAVLRGIAVARSCTVSAVALRWAMDQAPGIVHPIVGTRNATHIQDTLASSLSLQLTQEDANSLSAVLKERFKVPRGDCYSAERGEEF